jgi:serine/threonine-protein kinase
MCAALNVAHAAGIVHRDLKPANIMLLRRMGNDDFVKVLDFGVAKSYAQDQQTQLTHTGMLVGTVEYMAPEQILGGIVDARTDIYALGVLIYRMVTGRAPFREASVPTLILAHLNAPPVPMVRLDPTIPAALDRVVLKCLSKSPDARFDSMGALSLALLEALESTAARALADSDDPYDDGERTHVDGLTREPKVAPLGDGDAAKFDESYEDSTRRIEAASIDSGGDDLSRTIESVSLESAPESIELEEQTALMPRAPEVPMSAPPQLRECVFCLARISVSAQVCSTCGATTSAPRDAGQLLNPRFAGPRTAHLSAPEMPPPNSSTYGIGPSSSGALPVVSAPRPTASPNSGRPDIRSALASGPRPASAPAPEFPPVEGALTVWHRLFPWTRRRGR